jgi:molybdopterin-biosynthesis enzyme MoeA-like protein
VADAAVRARLLSIGSELLAGETVDSNAAFLARRLVGLGIALVGVQQLPDERETIAGAFVDAREEVELVMVTGGRARPTTTSPARAWPMPCTSR